MCHLLHVHVYHPQVKIIMIYHNLDLSIFLKINLQVDS